MARRVALVAVSLLALGPAAGPAHARTNAAAPPPAQAWGATHDWSLEVDGALTLDALFFKEQTSDRLLILPADMAEAVLLDQTGKKVTSLKRDSIEVAAGGESAQLAPGALDGRPVSQYTLDMQRGAVLFYLGSKRLKILTRAPLQGPTTPEEIFKHTPAYRKGMEAYRPEQGAIQTIKGHRGPVRIEVYFGSWCPHCKIVVPQFMKTISEAASRDLAVAYIGVPKGFQQWPETRSKGVRGLPTLIFYRDGREFSRIPGGAEDGPIEKMVAQVLTTSR